MTRENTGELYPRWAEVIRDGKAAVHGTGGARKYAKSLTAKPRPDIAEALAAVASSPVKLVFVPDEKMRQEMEMMVPVKEIKWLALGADLPPNAAGKLLAQGHDAASAARARDMLAGMLQALPPPAKISPRFVELVTPAVANDQIVLTLDKAKLLTAAKELEPALREARLKAQRVASMSNMRQILVACIMHASDLKGAWPEDLKAIEKFLGPKAKQVLSNPTRPDSGYVYVRPQQPLKNVATRLVLYEEHDDFGEGVSVGFADGHVEFVKDKKRFDELLAAAKTQQPQPVKP